MKVKNLIVSHDTLCVYVKREREQQVEVPIPYYVIYVRVSV